MSSQYFIVRLSTKPREVHGPFSTNELEIAIDSGKVSWTDLCWAPDKGDEWRRVYEITALKQNLAPLPTADKLDHYMIKCKEMLDPTKKSRTRAADDEESYAPVPATGFTKIFPKLKLPIYIQIQGNEHGPLSLDETIQILTKQKSNEPIYIWHKNLKRMHYLEEIPELAAVAVPGRNQKRNEAPDISAVYGTDLRLHPRIEFPASIRLNLSGASVPFGVCVDLSLSGIQILVDTPLVEKIGKDLIPGKILTLEMHPLSSTMLGIFTFTARIARFVRKDFRLGLEFIKLAEHDRVRLTQCLSELGKKEFK